MSCNNESDTDCNPLEESEGENDQSNSLDDSKNLDPHSGRPRTSKYWNYFKIDPTQNGIAICRFCHVHISFKSSVSNLGKHLNRKHLTEVESNILPDPLPEGILKENSDETEPLGLDESHVRRYFDETEFDHLRLLRCKACGEDCTGNNSTNLLKHALSHNKEEYNGKIESFLEDSGNENENVKPLSSKLRSVAWKHFTIVDGVRKLARCKICKRVFSYSTSVSNLLKHVNRKHGMDSLHTTHYDEDNDQHMTSEVAPVWAYFKCLSKTMKIASCLICKKRVIYSDDCTELKRHLGKKHPNIDFDASAAGKTFMVTDDGDFYEVQINKSEPVEPMEKSDSEIEYNEDFLDDTFDEPEQKVKIPVKRKSFAEHTTPKKIKVLVEPKAKPAEPDDSVDIFGKYIVSLLKKIPKPTAARLQYEFVKQALLAQDEKTVSEGTMTEEDVTTVTSNSDKIPVEQ